ncbi:MAG: hypothetical protein P8Y48_00340, partial [Novosphingobium sp.]
MNSGHGSGHGHRLRQRPDRSVGETDLVDSTDLRLALDSDGCVNANAIPGRTDTQNQGSLDIRVVEFQIRCLDRIIKDNGIDRPGLELIIYPVVAETRREQISVPTRTSIEDVTSGAAIEYVVSCAAGKPVDSAQTTQDIFQRTAIQPVRISRAVQIVRAGSTRIVIDPSSRLCH